MTDLAQLIARLEAASEGSRELDGVVAILAGWFRVQPRFTHNRKGGWIAPENLIGADNEGRPQLDSLHGTTIHRDPPRFTTSLDAIVALIERKLPGWHLQVEKHPGFCDATLWPSPDAPYWLTHAATMPLALCIAFLRALQAQQETSEDE